MDEMIWLEVPLHKNNVKYNFLEDEGVASTLKMSFDGSIMAVKRSCVEEHYKEQNVDMIRAGYGKLPDRRSRGQIEDAESLYKLLAFYVNLS